ncbi:MAG: succinate dehydrogenase, hydrophobic membrane anchor protein [Erythrobacter sp.]|uniref:succinate dehydrogenase, hydrophobic membrane anchor protein n=1 Tax=Erythrobacter sp. HL-111 TaxID=1798193 RepID=UPI0006D95A98|nr:succinate dehydrogenase, hydrophobic membrane anchor protein [Erythrobacter sp. HL-111]KPP96531.1 MAG: succinate dehydrogenase membrane anchor subunit SdhD [Erythrobacteraceae bacterium HL-111]SDS05956.1 succinate dehydrogenase subunit D [Erythrobacter sp. HL-111]
MGNGTSIGRVRGLGSSHDGAHHWLLQRTTAIGNLVVMTFLLVSFLMLPDFSHASVSGWLSQPVAAVPMALLAVSLFWHARLGLQVVIEDYMVDAGTKFALITAVNLAAIAGAAYAIFSVATLAFGAQA